MKLFFPVLSLLTVLLFAIPLASAQQIHKINTIESQSKQLSANTVSGTIQQRQYFGLNDESSVFDTISQGDVIEVEIAPGSFAKLRVNRVENYTPTTKSFIAVGVEDTQSTFTFTYKDGMLNGLFHKSHDDVYFFEYDKQIAHNYLSKSTSFYDDRDFCSIHEADHSHIGVQALPFQAKSAPLAQSRSYVPSTAAMTGSLDSETIIDVMMPYTANAKTWAESSSYGSIDNVIAQSMALSQSALDNSDTNVTLRLVHYYQTTYNEDTIENLSSTDPDYVSAGEHLRRLTRNDDNPFDLCSSSDCRESDFSGFFGDAHTLRDQYGADLVAAVLSEPNTGGIAWLNSSTSGSPLLGFSVNRVQQIANGYTLVHELGHNMGNAHARVQNSNASGEFGGLFAYSTGNLFGGSEGNYATVMGYSDIIFTRIPYFSNPDVEFSGAPTGNPITSTSDTGPSDNARSMREIKRVIASYRQSVIDAPVVDINTTSISADLNQQNRTAIVPVTIQNNGDSKLMWDFDFDVVSGAIANKAASNDTQTIEPADMSDVYGLVENISFTESDSPGVIFSTSFESSEGFAVGNIPVSVGWRSFSTTAPFEISDSNPSDGASHLRLPRRSESSSSTFARSPFFGPQPMGEFLITFDMAIQDPLIGGSGETFDMYAYDGSNASLSSGLIIANGNIFAYNVNELGDESFSFTGSSFVTDGEYRSVEILYKPDNNSVDYYLEGELIASNPYPFGKKPDYIYFGQRNDVSGTFMDIDNVRVERIFSPFSWLTTDSFAGTIAPGESETVNLTLTAEDVATGTYQTVLKLQSNDPVNPIIEVPITANIEMATSLEDISDVPEAHKLSQNYPNPFNPSTNIRFSLSQASDVTLEVYNITGQKVATLLQSRLPAGSHEQQFNASGLASGLYLYRLKTADATLTRQMILLK